MTTSPRKLVIDAKRQTATLFDGDVILGHYKISTAANGAGCTAGSYRTPTGLLRVAQKIGADAPRGTIFKSREPVGIWQGEKTNDDLILSRILWLAGMTAENENTFDRYIYLHGTNHEDKLGAPASHGCIRFSNDDIIALFDLMREDDLVDVIYP